VGGHGNVFLSDVNVTRCFCNLASVKWSFFHWLEGLSSNPVLEIALVLQTVIYLSYFNSVKFVLNASLHAHANTQTALYMISSTGDRAVSVLHDRREMFVVCVGICTYTQTFQLHSC